MKVKELIDKLKEFDCELEVVTYSDYDESGNDAIERVRLNDEYDPFVDEYDKRYVVIDSEWSISMNNKEALEIIKQYNLNPPKPIIKYYQDPYADGYGDASGYYAEMPPIDPLVIDAILERDKDCKEYIPDSESYADEKFNQEMERRFTDLMSRAGDTAVDEYRKNNSQLYSMVTENHYNKITVIPMSLSTLCDFKEKCEKAAGEIGLKNFYIHEHEDDNDLNGKTVYGSAPYSGLFINDAVENVFSGAIRYCDYLKQHAKESQIYETVESLCSCIKERIEDLYKIIELDYMQRINNYIDKEQFSGKNYE